MSGETPVDTLIDHPTPVTDNPTPTQQIEAPQGQESAPPTGAKDSEIAPEDRNDLSQSDTYHVTQAEGEAIAASQEEGDILAAKLSAASMDNDLPVFDSTSKTTSSKPTAAGKLQAPARPRAASISTQETDARYTLHIFRNAYVIVPRAAQTDFFCVIDRDTHAITKQPRHELAPNSVSVDIYGVLGIFELLAGPYLVVITHATDVGKLPCIDGQCRTVFQVRHTAAFPFPTRSGLTHSKRLYEQAHLDSLRDLLDDRGFLFAEDPSACDLTRTMQQQEDGPRDGPWWRRLDGEFLWNAAVLESFLNADLIEWACPVIRGFLSIQTCELDGSTFRLALVSRRSVNRPGLRYKCRGLDKDGHCANYVETEQIVLYEAQAQVSSFVQIRASLPLFWRQDGKKFKPKITFSETDELSIEAMTRHFNDMHNRYGDLTVLSLLRTKEGEGELQSRFKGNLEVFKPHDYTVGYVQFDFHRYCKGGARPSAELWNQNLRVPMYDTAPDSERYQFFHANTTDMACAHEVYTRQQGVIRTNCLDCLDRTNVLQTQLARRCLWQQLAKVGITDNALSLASLDDLFNNLWADNGNAIARQYAGSDALNADFTRTGKRHLSGMIRDGVSSLRRYYNHNFGDHMKMQSIGLMSKRFHLDMSARPDVTNAAVAECRRKVEASTLEEGEFVVDAWPLTAVSKLDLEKECVLILTNRAYYRAQCSFADCEMMSVAKVPLSHIQNVKPGLYHYSHFAAQGRHNRDEDTDGQYYGVRIVDQKPRQSSGSGAFSKIKNALASAVSQPRTRTFKPVGQYEPGDRSGRALIDNIAMVLKSTMSMHSTMVGTTPAGSSDTGKEDGGAEKKGGFWTRVKKGF